jgi:ParB/RepB/Spo0J family partition protein
MATKKSTPKTPKEYPTSGEPAAGADETMIAQPVRILPDLVDELTGTTHMWAGLYGDIVDVTPFGTYMVEVMEDIDGPRRCKQFDRSHFELVDAQATAPAAEAAQPASIEIHGTLEVTDHHINLVEAAPVLAINSPTNPRRRRGLDIDSLRALADSLQAHGLMQPIIVRPLPGHRLADTASMEPRPAYEIIVGERRWRAAQLAELATLPMLVRQLSDDQVLELQLVENIEREDLDAMEEAEGFALLRDKLGYTVDQIAERIGKGKGASYVRKTMKLLDLTPESRDAMFDGHLGRSTGLLVARYPAERQAEVVKYIKAQATKSKTGTDPAPFRAIASMLYSHFNTVLKDAAFNTEDASLVTAAGACSACPKRTGFHQDLFGDADQANTDSCTDADCFASKKAAHVVIVRRNAEAAGCAVIDGDNAREIKPYREANWLRGYSKLEEPAYTEIGTDGTEREVTFGDALRAMGKKAPKPSVYIDPDTSAASQVIPQELAQQLRARNTNATAGVTTPPRATNPEPKEVDTRPPEVQAWAAQNGHLRRAVLLRLFDTVRGRDRTIDELRNTARVLLISDFADGVHDYLGWATEIEEASYDDVGELLRAKLEALPADELGQIVTMASIEYLLTSYDVGQSHEQDVALIESYGIDILALRDKVHEDLARQSAPAAGTDAGADADTAADAEGEEEDQGEGAEA